MDRSRHAMMEENGGQTIAFLNFDLAEYQARKRRDGFRWGVEGWYGGDVDRLTLKSEGECAWGEGVEAAELQLRYSRARPEKHTSELQSLMRISSAAYRLI